MSDVGFIRVSTPRQDGRHQKERIKNRAMARGVRPMEWVVVKAGANTDTTAKMWRQAVDAVGADGTLYVFEISRCGRTVSGILSALEYAHGKGVPVWSASDDKTLGVGIEGKVLATVLALVAEIEHQLIKERAVSTSDGIAACIAEKGHYITKAGRKLTSVGRPKGSTRPPRHFGRRDEIMAMRERGATVAEIARLLQCSRKTVYAVINYSPGAAREG